MDIDITKNFNLDLTLNFVIKSVIIGLQTVNLIEYSNQQNSSVARRSGSIYISSSGCHRIGCLVSIIESLYQYRYNRTNKKTSHLA